MKTTTFLKLLFVLICSLLQFESFGQKQANNWYFGYGAGINFNYNPPRAVYGGQSNSPFGHASISDTNGNLLFYTGNTSNNGLFGQQHQPIANSNNIHAAGGVKNSLIVPWPGQPQKYYVFYTSLNQYEAYSVVDMALNNGLGAVTPIKDQYLTYQLWADVIGVKHRNNRDYWVVYQDSLSNKFKSYLIGPGGINTISVNSTINAIPGVYIVENNLKASPDGKTIAFSDRLSVSNNTNSIKLLNFDATSGQLTFKGILPDSNAGAMEFSPDGSKLYTMRHGSTPISPKGYPISLLQYDLDLPTATDIFNSAVVVWQDTVMHYEGYLQVGPDGKIYIIGDGISHYLHVIHRPNLKGTACRFVPNGFDLDPLNVSGIYNGIKLPTFIQSYFYRPKITMQQTCFGDTARFTLSNPAYVDSVDWNFGDPASGAQNTSTLFNPKHFYATPGPKQVQAIVHFNFYSDTLSQTIYIPVGITKPNLGNDTTLCTGDTLILNAYQPGASYEWQDSINTDSVYVVTRPGTYWVSVSNGCGTLGDSITVNFSSPLSLALPKDTLLCPGQTLTLQLNPQGGNLLWSDSTAANSFTVSRPGTYWAELSNACGSWRDSITVSYRPVVKNNWLPNDTTLCNTSPFIINGTNPAALSYKWQDGSTFSSFTATVSGTYWLEITTACTTLRDSIHVTINKLPETSFQDTILCSGDSFTLTAPKALSYRWNTGDTAQSISINQAGKYKVELETVKGCFYSDSLEVKTERCFKTAFIPNIVTPNNDQLNDRFEPKGLETGEYELSIYNRWGTRIYQQQNYTNQWPEEKISAGTYYYLLRNKQTGKTYKGWVEVIK